MLFAVFLDVDGVLNTRTTCQHTPDGYTGIDNARVEILANAIKKYDSYEVKKYRIEEDQDLHQQQL